MSERVVRTRDVSLTVRSSDPSPEMARAILSLILNANARDAANVTGAKEAVDDTDAPQP